VRGPVRLVRTGMTWNDFLSPYIQAKAWAQGKDPYSAQSLILLWPPDSRRPSWVVPEAAAGVLEMKRGIPTPYPLTSLVTLSPFTVLSWSVALRLWIAINVAAVLLTPFAMVSICGVGLLDFRARLFLAVAFALACLHTGLGTANPAMLAVCLTVATVWAERIGREKLAGVFLALAVCLKPTVAAGLLLYYLVRRRWKIAGIACAATVVVGIVGVTRLALAGVPWVSSYLENTRRIFAPGALADFTKADPSWFNMINAQVFFYGLVGKASVANLLSLLLAAALLGCWFWLCRRRPTPSGSLEISAVSVLILIPVYHRFYDASLLIWPLAWSLLFVRKRLFAVLTLATIFPFLVPGAALLDKLALAGRIPSAIANGWWWNSIVMPHEAWDLILLAMLLLYFMSRDSVGESEAVGNSSKLEAAIKP